MLTAKGIKEHRCYSSKTSNFLSDSFVCPFTNFPNSLTDYHVLQRNNFNLTVAQQELALWYQRWAHCSLARVQMILARPRQSKKSAATGEQICQMVKPRNDAASSCPPICCAACQYAKQKRRTPDSTKLTKVDANIGSRVVGDLSPGDRVSCDHYVSSKKGRLSHTKGKESIAKQLVGGTIFVDHATGFVVHSHQNNLSADATVMSKIHCEKVFSEFGIKVKGYAADNHPFRSEAWKNDCETKNQLPTQHSGVGAHYQNVSKQYIETIFN